MKFAKILINMTVYFNIIVVPIAVVIFAVLLLSKIISYQDWMIWIGLIAFIIGSIVVLYDLALNDPMIK